MIKKFYTLITGASEGLGKALAIECASRKMNLLLVALPNSGLENLCEFIHKNYGVKVVHFETDLTQENSCEELFRLVLNKGILINILINNAGIGSTLFFNEGSLELFQKQIKLNILSTTTITRLFLDQLEQNSPSYILNVSSLSCFFYLPRKQVYGATKSFIYSFSKSLKQEVEQYGIKVCVLCPGGINSNPAQTLLNKTGTWFSRQSIMNPEEIALITINGLLKGKEVIIPGYWNRLFLLLDKLVPTFIKNRITMYTMKKINAGHQFTEAKKIGKPLTGMVH